LLRTLASFLSTAASRTEIYTLSLHDALPISVFAEYEARLDADAGDWLRRSLAALDAAGRTAVQYALIGGECLLKPVPAEGALDLDRKSTRLNSSHVSISYAVFCLKKKKQNGT